MKYQLSMEELTKFNNQTAGRDKVFRLVQYTSKIVWYSLSNRKSCETSVERAKRLDESLGLMRRLLRFGRFHESLQSAIPVMISVTDPVVRFCCVLSRISSSCFMLIDHIVCLHKLGVLSPTLINPARWDRTSTKFWLYSITLGLIRDLHEIRRIYKEEYQDRPFRPRKLSSSRSRPPPQPPKCFHFLAKNAAVAESLAQCQNLCYCIGDHADVAIDTLKNFCDLFLPLNTLGFVNLTPASIGLLGVISTIASALPQFNPMVKMVPAT